MTALYIRSTPAHRIGALVLALAASALSPAAARAQTLADLFNPDALHEVRLFINSRDLGELREKYRENTYYTADLLWQGTQYLDVLEECARSAAEDGWLVNEVDRLSALASGPAAEDTLKQFSTDAFVLAVDRIRRFASERSGLVLEEVARARAAE